MQMASYQVQAFRDKAFHDKSCRTHQALKRVPSAHVQRASKPDMSSLAESCTPLQAIHFQGLTGILRGRHWVSGDDFQKLVTHQKALRDHEEIGVLPMPFVRLFAPQPKQAFAFFNALSAELKQLTLMSHKTFTASVRNHDMPLAFEDVGTYGQVYKVSVPTLNPNEPLKHYALKIYHLDAHAQQTFVQNWPKDGLSSNHPGPSVHGTLHEQASGLYFSDEPIANLARFHFGNPLQGWAVSEWIDHDADSSKRPGPKLHEKVPFITIGDDKNENHQGDVRVDLGGIFKPKSPSSKITTDLEDKTPVMPIDFFSDKALIKQLDFDKLDQNTLPTALDRLLDHLKQKPPEETLNLKAFETAYDYSQAFHRIADLPGDAQKVRVFEQLKALKRPEFTPLLFKLVEYLPAAMHLQTMINLLPQLAPETPVHLLETISYRLIPFKPAERGQFNQAAFDWIHARNAPKHLEYPQDYTLTFTAK